MTNPTVLKSYLRGKTVPNYEARVCEEAIYPGALVTPSNDHSPNGIKNIQAEDPPLDITGSHGFKIGVVEVPGATSNGRAIHSSTLYDKSTQIPDNYKALVHWLKPGDEIVCLATAGDHGALEVGDPMIPQTAGTLGSPDAEAALDITCHTFSVETAVETADTLVNVSYVGIAGHDAA